MSQNNDSGDRTEKPTPKRLLDARKKGDIAKSKDVTSTVGLAVWTLTGVFGIGFVANRFAKLGDRSLDVVSDPSISAMGAIGGLAVETLLIVFGLIVTPVILISLLAEFIQAGPVLTFEKMKPKLSHLNPADGFKRMFSMDNLFEVLKSVIKTALLLAVGWAAGTYLFGDFVRLQSANTASLGAVMAELVFLLFVGTIVIFIIVSGADAAYQRHSFIKKNKMSRRDIKQEFKENEGDPQLKQERKQRHQEWSSQGGPAAARSATALLVNPTHLAVALDYSDEEGVPIISAKGEGDMALAMRKAAEEAETPVLRDVPLTRALYARVPEQEPVPADLFEAIAAVIVWAQRLKNDHDGQDGDAQEENSSGVRDD